MLHPSHVKKPVTHVRPIFARLLAAIRLPGAFSDWYDRERSSLLDERTMSSLNCLARSVLRKTDLDETARVPIGRLDPFVDEVSRRALGFCFCTICEM